MVTYTAPDSAEYETRIVLQGSLSDGSTASCTLVLQEDEALGVQDDGQLDGLVGNVYQLEDDTATFQTFH